MRPVVVVNLKAYEEGSDKRALKIVEIASRLVKEGADIRIAAQAVDIRLLANRSVMIYGQHADPVTPGAHTGFVSPFALRRAGAVGTILNHSEHRLRFDVLEDSVNRCHSEGLRVICCAADDHSAQGLVRLMPEFIAVEPKELIGGEISVSSAHPDLISNSVKAVGNNLLVGAGVKSSEDMRIALKLGAKGVLLASHVVFAQDPEKVLRELAFTN
jgi:triosephosphate isomerase